MRKYDRLRRAVMGRDSVGAWYQGHYREFSPFMLGTKAGEPHVLGYQFGGTSEHPIRPYGDPDNWRCLRVAELTRIKLLPGIWHSTQNRDGQQHCIDQVDVWSGEAEALAEQIIRHAA